MKQRRLMSTVAVPVVAAAVAAGSVAAPAAANAAAKPATMCQSNPSVYWQASKPQQAWVPTNGYLQPGAFTKGESYSVDKGQSKSEEQSYTLSTQLGINDGINIGIFSDQVSANISSSTEWSSTVSVSVDTTRNYPDPLPGNAQPVLFLQGYRVKATVYSLRTFNTGPVRCKFVPTTSQYVYLYHKNPVPLVGWVNVGVTPHAVVGAWGKVTVTNPGN